MRTFLQVRADDEQDFVCEHLARSHRALKPVVQWGLWASRWRLAGRYTRNDVNGSNGTFLITKQAETTTSAAIADHR